MVTRPHVALARHSENQSLAGGANRPLGTGQRVAGRHLMGQTTPLKTPLCKALAFAAGLGLSMLSCPLHAAPASCGDTVQGLYDALLSTMKNGRILGQSGRFTQLEPVIRRTFDIPAMVRLSVGPTWTSLTEAQRQQVNESFGRYISAI